MISGGRPVEGNKPVDKELLITTGTGRKVLRRWERRRDLTLILTAEGER